MSKAHVELSPSAAQRWWNCPGSVALCRTVPKLPSSQHAQGGTAAHKVLEKCAKSLKNQDGYITPYDMLGMEIEGFEVTEEMADAVTQALDFVKAELQIGGELFVELKVDVIPGVVEGTLDLAIVRHFDTIVVADYKHGKGVLVRPEDNPQMLLYGLGLLKRFEAFKLKLAVIQPRAFNDEPIACWECDREYLETFEAELLRHIEMTREESAMLVPGDKQCRWCDAKAVCPALRQEVAQAMQPVKGSEILFPKAESLPIATIVNLLDYTDRIEEWLKAIWAHAEQLLEKGIDISGYELKKRRANRVWIDEAKVAAAFAHLGNDIFNLKLKSPAQIEKLVPKEELETVKTLTEIPDKGVTIAKATGQKPKGKKNGKEKSID